MKRVVAICPENGVFLGEWMGMVFFTLLDAADQPYAVTFADEEQARTFSRKIAGIDQANLSFIEVEVMGDYADAMSLIAAGVDEKMVAPMVRAEAKLISRIQPRTH